jgi:GNAT superfamily N-acetyltransferase
MDIKVRKAVFSEAEELFCLVHSFATSFHTNRVAFEDSLKIIMSDQSAFLRVAESNSQLIGYCLGFDHYTFYANGRVSWLEEIMVQEDYQMKGVGRKLMEAFETWAMSRESKLIALATRRASSFYQALHYKKSAIYFRKILE